MNAQCYQILTDAYKRYLGADGGTWVGTDGGMPSQPVTEMLAKAIVATLKMDEQVAKGHNMNTTCIQIRVAEIRVGDIIDMDEVIDVMTSEHSPTGCMQTTTVTFTGGRQTRWSRHRPYYVCRSLKPCPFCKGKASMQSQVRQHTTMHQVYCLACCANLGWYNTEVDAVDRWNRRS